jgi:large subunit ribosomal protein L9
MKVILLQDVEKLGTSHDVVEVADGFARNFLVPRGLAIPGTKSAMSQLDNMKRVEDRRQNRARGAAQELAGKLEGQKVNMPANVGAQGRLYGSIGSADIADEVQKQLGISVDRKSIALPEAIREIGLYQVPVALHRDVKVTLTVQVGDMAAIHAAQAEASAAAGQTEAQPAEAAA